MANTHFKKHLIHRCTVQRTTPAQSASGEPIDSWADVGTVSCRYVEKQERYADESLGLMIAERPLLLMNSGEDVIEEDRIITVTLKADASVVDAGPFTILALLKRNSRGAHHISLQLERVE